MQKGITIVTGLFYIQILFCQHSGFDTINRRGDIRVMFYNTENLFDSYNDTLVNDEEFLPGSEKKWTYDRFHHKTINLYKTIAAIGETKPPEIICFAEVENKYVLLELIRNTPLEKYPYGVVHFDSPDPRGIDVGLLYRKDVVQPIQSRPINISHPSDTLRTTRDILFLQAVINSSDTLNLFVNHWPSRRSGVRKSEPLRMQAASTLRKNVDSILGIDPCANIIITGDFNDEPFNRSMKESLKTLIPDKYFQCDELYNLSESLMKNCYCGTYRYESVWNMFDQFIVSGALLDNKQSISTCAECIHIADFDFLLIEDEQFGGRKPFRTYVGPVYKGGFSDHMPVYLDLYY